MNATQVLGIALVLSLLAPTAVATEPSHVEAPASQFACLDPDVIDCIDLAAGLAVAVVCIVIDILGGSCES